MWIPLDDESATVDQVENTTQESALTTEDVESIKEDTDNPNHDNTADNTDTDEDINDTDSEYGLVVYCSCKAFWTSKPGHAAIYVFFILLFLASLAAFCVVIQMIVVPYCKVSLFQATNCTVMGVVRLFIDSHCTCTSKGCDARYMCLSVHVQFPDEWGILHNASIAENEVLLGKNVSMT